MKLLLLFPIILVTGVIVTLAAYVVLALDIMQEEDLLP